MRKRMLQIYVNSPKQSTAEVSRIMVSPKNAAKLSIKNVFHFDPGRGAVARNGKRLKKSSIYLFFYFFATWFRRVPGTTF